MLPPRGWTPYRCGLSDEAKEVFEKIAPSVREHSLILKIKAMLKADKFQPVFSLYIFQ